jgi:hypothetical protein
VERVTRIELALSAWEADVLPLNYTREALGLRRTTICRRREPARTSYRTVRPPADRLRLQLRGGQQPLVSVTAAAPDSSPAPGRKR